MSAILEARGLVKGFGALRALDGLDLSLEPRGVLGIIGPNGSGKTTLFRVLSGQLRPDQGKVLLQGRDITAVAEHLICRRGLALTSQITQPFPEMTVRENIMVGGMFGAGFSREMARLQAEELLEFSGLASLAQAPAGEITLAQRRRLELARALATRPRVMLLDENMAGLTPAEMAEALELLKAINQRGIALVVVEHIMQVVMGICREVMVLEAGRVIAQGAPREVMADPKVVSAYLGASYA
jgi:branched-chain amino acid transport system ATP-binding protein